MGYGEDLGLRALWLGHSHFALGVPSKLCGYGLSHTKSLCLSFVSSTGRARAGFGVSLPWGKWCHLWASSRRIPSFPEALVDLEG